MKVKVIGRNRPFWGGSLLKIGDVVDVPKDVYDDEKQRAKWMGKPTRKPNKVVEAPVRTQEIPNVV